MLIAFRAYNNPICPVHREKVKFIQILVNHRNCGNDIGYRTILIENL